MHGLALVCFGHTNDLRHGFALVAPMTLGMDLLHERVVCVNACMPVRETGRTSGVRQCTHAST
eukprot:366017-Chlamydomonas_euryale.AAC.13